MAIYEYKFPELGEGIHEGEIVKWLVKPGDVVNDETIIMEVQNDKSTVEVPAPVEGKIVEIKVAEGTVCTIGDLIATIEVAGEVPQQAGGHGHGESAAPLAPTEAAPAAKGEGQDAECAVGGAVAANVANSKLDTPLAGGEAPKAAGDAGGAAAGSKALATPSVRKLAREKGLNIGQVTASGPNGRVTKEDVLAFAAGGGAPAAAAKAASEAPAATDAAPAAEAGSAAPSAAAAVSGERIEERVPFKGIRKAIANAMVKSVYTAPHVTLMDEVDVTQLVALREKAKPIAEKKGVKITYLPFIVKALVAAARQFPAMNAMIDEEKNEIVYKKYYHIGIATDTDNGLIVPVIQDADRKNIWTIAAAIKDLAARGRDGKLTSAEMRGSTLSITNIGSAGGMFFTPVINFPEVAILGTGRITEKPVVKNGEIVIAPVMALSLSFDHRIIDGATAQQFVNYIKQLLADPELLIMEV
ncbi:dihydrolipoamide acetyltransferase family protein [Paenibacillus agricola]|uniref:Dihydrolipoamide acetyltransferase component of pyruvate dehydrogenase complex n=1 Tax=Paenibacillus agricola TaxID=2716264 RepID=A0ABX0J7K9_9BACL|nr:dihydrolipoamide acetyltransferase family protein [Paenibacillus agricola]NHN30011.1 2-oxo acid dehydrogenase subunit E2 [Paenibacillus agricola]